MNILRAIVSKFRQVVYQHQVDQYARDHSSTILTKIQPGILPSDRPIIGVSECDVPVEQMNRCSFNGQVTRWVKPADAVNLGNRPFFVVYGDFCFRSVAKKLRACGLKDGIDFLSIMNAEQFRNAYQKQGTQRQWKDVESDTKLSKRFWMERIQLMRDMIEDDCKSVLDLGCWECELESLLPDTVQYIGCDYVKRRDDTIVCDLNNYEFPEIAFDVAYISGSLEYMEHLDWYFDQISKAEKMIVMSYSALEYYPLIDLRKGKSWVSHLSSLEIIQALAERGFELSDSAFWGQWTVIMKFKRINSNA